MLVLYFLTDIIPAYRIFYHADWSKT